MADLTGAEQKDPVRGLQGSPRMLLVHAPSPELKEVAQLLRSLCQSVDIVSELAQISSAATYDLLLINHDGLSDPERATLLDPQWKLARIGRVALLSGKACGPDLAGLLERRVLTNLVGKEPAWQSNDVLVTVSKILRKDVFGLEKYYAWGLRPRVYRVTRSTEKGQLLEEAEVYARTIGVHPRLVDLFCNVADELLSNALYNAPVDDRGRTRYAHLDRTSAVELKPGEEVEVKFACDGRRLGISTADPFGSLAPDRVLEYLARCLRKGADQIDDKRGGAGLGFYCILNSVTHFVVNIAPGRRTEVIGLIDVRGSYRDFLNGSKSFNVFVGQ